MFKNKRRGLLVYVYSFRNLNALKKLGLIYYMSRRMNYILMYVDQSDIEITIQKIEKLHYVRRVEMSHFPDIDPTFKDALTAITGENNEMIHSV